LVAQWTENAQAITLAELGEPGGAGADNAVDHTQHNAIRCVLSAGEGKGAGEHCLRREQIAIVQGNALARPPIDRLGVGIFERTTTVKLNEIARLGWGERRDE
jgi:hypothetical protein